MPARILSETPLTIPGRARVTARVAKKRPTQEPATYGSPLNFPVLEGIDPTEPVRQFGAAAYSQPVGEPTVYGPAQHHPKLGKPRVPLWCALLTRLIKPGSEELKSAASQEAQYEERTKLETQGIWDDVSTVREWSSIRADPTLTKTTVAR
eukprot:10681731-Heterocapsa_arctica.AAC.1